MAVFLSPGVFTREIDLSILPSNTGALRPAFVGVAKKGPMNVPVLITTAQQYIDTFGEPFPESYLGYAVLAYLEEGASCYVLRVGIEYYEGIRDSLSPIAIDTSGAKRQGWGRIPVFKGLDLARIRFREVGDGTTGNPEPVVIHAAGVVGATGGALTGAFNDAEIADESAGAVTATLDFSDENYNGCLDEVFTLTFTGDPVGTGSEILDGATYIITDSSGDQVTSGTITVGTGTPNISEEITLPGLGISFTITIDSGGAVAANDTIIFSVRPDNTEFSVIVEGVAQGPFTITPGTYSSADALVTALDAAITGGGGIDFSAAAVANAAGNDVPALQGTNRGEWLQITGTCAFCAEVGIDAYSYDIQRSHLIGTEAGPYSFSSSNNRVVMDVISGSNTVQFDFSLPVATGITATAVAAAIDANNLYNGVEYFDSFALKVPSGTTGGYTERVVIVTSTARQYDQLKLQATFTFLATLRFADEIGINYPYTSIYRTFTDARLWLPTQGTDPATPASCDIDELSDDCAADSLYYENIVGWFVAKYAGTWSDTYTLSLEVFTEGVGDVSGRFKITVRDAQGVQQDVVQDVTFNPADTRYIGNVVNEGSPIGGVNGNMFYQWEERPDDLSPGEVRVPSPFTNRAFTGGQNGIATGDDSTYLDQKVIGNAALSTGIYAFQNPESFDFNLLATPGFSTGPIIAQAIQFCENRGDVLYLVDPPQGLRPQQVIDWHNGMLYSDLTAALNTSYAALYWSWLKVSDQFNGGTIWVPPSGHIAAVFARTDRETEQWFAPAGLNRGRLLSALDIEYNPTQGERDALYGSGNAVNAIVNFTQEGITVWGQRTLQRRSSALDRVNVRMLCIFLKKNLQRLLRNFVFEFNDAPTRSQIRNIINPFLGDIAARRGLTAFLVVCDESNNTPERIDRNELWVSVFIKPARVAEFIVLNLVVLRTGASFGAQEVLAAGGVVTG